MITIVNGGTQGLGEAVARRLLDTGFTTGVTLTGRSRSRGLSVADELTSAGLDAIFIGADALDPSMPQEVVAQTVERFGRVDGVVNVAATTTRAGLFDETPAHLDQQFAVNVKAPYPSHGQRAP